MRSETHEEAEAGEPRRVERLLVELAIRIITESPGPGGRGGSKNNGDLQ